MHRYNHINVNLTLNLSNLSKKSNLIISFILYFNRDSSFISTQIFVLNLAGWFGVLANKFIIFDIPSLYHYINIKTISNLLFFFWKCKSFFRYFFIILICNCVWIILIVNFFKLFWFFNIPLYNIISILVQQ